MGRATDGFDAYDTADTAAEVSAAFRVIRRVASSYMAVAAAVVVATPLVGVAVGWWSGGRVVGGLSPSFAFTAGGLYLVFVVLAVLSTRLVEQVEDRMLGGREFLDDPEDPLDPAGPTP